MNQLRFLQKGLTVLSWNRFTQKCKIWK